MMIGAVPELMMVEIRRSFCAVSFGVISVILQGLRCRFRGGQKGAGGDLPLFARPSALTPSSSLAVRLRLPNLESVSGFTRGGGLYGTVRHRVGV